MFAMNVCDVSTLVHGKGPDRDANIMTATERNGRTVPWLPFFFQTKRLRKRMNGNLFSQSNASNSCSETSTFLVAGVEDRKNPA